jgi:hypothetical protein
VKVAADAAAVPRPRRNSLDKREAGNAMDGLMDSLVQFSIEQRRTFDAGAWLAKFEEKGEAVALAAKYLSMTSWYGHEAELEYVTEATHAFADNSNGLHLESRAMGFDLHTFSLRVRLGLAEARRDPPRAERPAALSHYDEVREES